MLLFTCGEDDSVDQDNPVTENQAPSMTDGLSAVFTDNTNVNVTWNAATDPDNDEITYMIELYEYLTFPNSEYYEIRETYQTTDTQFVITDIEEANTNYQIIVKAKDSFDNLSENDLRTIVNYGNLAPLTVTEVVLDKSQSSMDINWTHAIDPENHEVTYRIDLYQHTDFPFEEPNYMESFTTNTNSLTINNLSPLIKYSFEIFSIDAYYATSEPFEMYFALLPEGTYTGDIILRDQSDVDVFLNHNIQTVDGNVIISAPHYGEGYYIGGIGDLWPLHGFEVITGNLILESYGHHGYSSFAAFNQLHTINGQLFMFDTGDDLNNINIIRDLSQFSSLQTIGELLLINNFGGLTGEFTLLENIIGALVISGNGYNTFSNNATYSFGFPVIQTIEGNLSITNNANLTAITGFDNLTEIGGDFNLNQYGTSIPLMNSLTTISGDLNINTNDIANLSGLNNLASISGDLNIYQYLGLTSFYNFNNLTSVGGSFIHETYWSETSILPTFNNLQTIGNQISIVNSTLTNLDLFQNITILLGLELINNPNLSNLNSLNLNHLETLKIVENDALTNLSFNNVTIPSNTLVEVFIEDNENLTSLTGLNGFSHFNSLEIIDNPLLTDISALNAVTIIDNCLQIHNNDDLTNLDFLSNLTTINCGDKCLEFFGTSTSATNNLVIKGNYNLGDYCGLTNFFTNNGLCFEEYSILENGYNPTHLDIINGNCIN